MNRRGFLKSLLALGAVDTVNRVYSFPKEITIHQPDEVPYLNELARLGESYIAQYYDFLNCYSIGLEMALTDPRTQFEVMNIGESNGYHKKRVYVPVELSSHDLAESQQGVMVWTASNGGGTISAG